MINAGANVNARDERGYGPLHWASYRGFLEITKMLLAKGAFVNAKSKAGLTPHIQASSCGHQAIVELLLSKGASVNESDEEGWTPLHKAVANGHEETVKTLMDAGADSEIPQFIESIRHSKFGIQGNLYRGFKSLPFRRAMIRSDCAIWSCLNLVSGN